MQLNKPDEESSLGGLFHDPLWGTAQRKSPVSLLRRLPEFFISIPSSANYVCDSGC